MKLIKKCEICESKEFEFVFEGKDKLLGIPGKFNLFKCKKCGGIFLNPQPSFKELGKYYSPDKYYSLKFVDKYSKKTKLKLWLYELYFNPKKKNYLMSLFFSPIKFMVRGTRIKKNEKLLDIGSGSGQFLYEMKSLGLDVYGVEPGEFDEKATKKEGLEIKKSNLKEAKFKKETFDLITMSHVLEHVSNPLENLEEIHRILKKNGRFIISVPNYNSLAYKIFGSNWYQLDIPRHLFDYSDKILKRVLEERGFKIIKMRYNSRPSQFVVSLYFVFDIKEREGFWNRVLEVLFLPLTWIVNFLRIGDQIEIWCVKK